MHPTLSTSERVVKKVSRACNTCRLKRKKCDGLDPCAFCVDNKLECLYSKEPRRRGPPSGYLRYTETRVTILEILLGLYLSKLSSKKEEDVDVKFDPFLDIAKTLQSEAKTCTQDIWDAHKAIWTRCPSAKLVEELVVSFAPFTPRSAQEAPAKTLLPPPTTSAATSTAHDRHSNLSTSTHDGKGKSNEKSRNPTNPIPFQNSFERTSSHELTDATPPAMSTEGEAPPSARIASNEERRDDWHDNNSSSAHQPGSYMAMQQHPSSDLRLTFPPHQSQPFKQQDVVPPHNASSSGVRGTSDMEIALALGGSPEYTGSYWRSVDLAAPESETYTSLPMAQFISPQPPTNQLDLPPSHILSRLLDVYYQHSHPSYPLLPSRGAFDAIILSPSGKSELLSTLVLSICAYSGRLSPSTHPASNSLAGAGGLAGKIAADLWYEQARTSLSALLKKGSSLELVQAALILALRDYGKGNESQAWILVGLAVRLAQDLQLHEDPPSDESLPTPPEDAQLRRNIWGVCSILDLLLSLQMGRPPASSDVLKGSSGVPARRSPPANDVNPSPPFTYAVSLSRVIAMINLQLYLGYHSPVAQTQQDKLSHLRTELDMWHHSLPMQYHISIGHHPRRDVLEINMLYHVAVILLYRPISREQLNQQATDIFLEAASNFNVLLENYRQSQVVAQPGQANDTSALSHTNPHMIYLIYTVAIAHLSGYKLRQVQQGNGNGLSSISHQTSALQTQLHLLKCLEALASIGSTWELARRCWKALDVFMETENLKPRAGEATDENNSLTLGKRKREAEENKRSWPVANKMDNPDVRSETRGPATKQQHPSQSFPVNMSPSSVPDLGSMPTNPPNQFAPGYSQLPSHPPPNVGVSNWDAPNISYTSTTEAALPVFDPSLFSTRWMPNTSQVIHPEWDGSWEESTLLPDENGIEGIGFF